MRKGSLILVVAAATMSLSGCQLFSPGHGNSLQATQTQPDMASYFDQRLADGRRHLQAGRLSHAITAYRQASYSADHTARAHNGLAIAFDKLGRRDLAEHYFASAMALAPDDAMIARNVARFDSSAVNTDEVEMAVLAAQQAAPKADSFDQAGSIATDGATARTHGLVRARDGGIVLGVADSTAPVATMAAASVRKERPAVVHVGRAAPATQTAQANVEERAGYPVRVHIAEAPAEYPVRVQIGKNSGRTSVKLEDRRGPPNGRTTTIRISSPRG
ncbi:tetratricopeptide repeat protein [Aurantiacibacter rhizosphaerae]|uniref:Tetratricopeptide repeat protein n=1 Tax=Aurantiacibacter rhizosphaerae TaxID=2691582 RepID=A0A844XHD4_9SPHN|nr:hypothetical protein [Aurantiacibacter rhizosphaerae]MWV28945.1 hypothetical protein [Aurantiacibacter rhizosphaerae]